MGGFCLLMELHWEGSALQPAQQACYGTYTVIFKGLILNVLPNFNIHVASSECECAAGLVAPLFSVGCQEMHKINIGWKLERPTLHCTVYSCSALPFNALHCNLMLCMAWHRTALHYNALHYSAVQYTTLHCAAQSQ